MVEVFVDTVTAGMEARMDMFASEVASDGTHVVFAKTFKRSETDPVPGDQVDVHLPVRRAHAVFNVD